MRALLRALTILALCMGAALVCAVVFVVMLQLSLPPSDLAYGAPLWKVLRDPFVFNIAARTALGVGLISFPFVYFATRKLRLVTSALFIFGAVLVEILLVTPFGGLLGFIGSPFALILALITCRFSDWRIFAQST
jgi:hypothetical protein